MAIDEKTELQSQPEKEPQANGKAPLWWRQALGILTRRQRAIPLWEVAAYASLIAVALGMRFWDLGSRAMHHDESLHAFYSWNLYNGGGYQHNPMMHGPFQFQINAAIFFVLGDSDFTSRLLYAVVGTALVALPFFLRSRLGQLGALFTAVMLAFSPTMLYYSRFTRNDILMAVWTLGLVVCIWRYMDEGKNRYLYIAAALLALAFASKETAYLMTATMGLFLTLMVLPSILAEIGKRTGSVEGMSPPAAMWRVITASWSAVKGGINFASLPRAGVLLLMLVTLTLPQWSALSALLQETPLLGWLNVTLANPDGVFPIGAPAGGGIIIAAVIAVALLILSIYWGAKWNWRVWWRCALIFYVIWGLFYSTFFTNPVGLGSGMWQSLGYWVAQQEVARGSQPWYYYFAITPLYEFLPLIFSLVAAVFFLRRKDTFSLFLVLWASVTFVLYTVASEKMPWLLVNVALPLIVLAGKFLGELVQGIEWSRVKAVWALPVVVGVPAFGAALWWMAFFEPGDGFTSSYTALVTMAALAIGMVALGIIIARRIGTRNFGAFAAIAIALGLMGLTVRTAAAANYSYGDIPVEMLIYTQSTPDIPRLDSEISRVVPPDAPVIIDGTSGFTWPWAWYLRDHKPTNYPGYSNSDIQADGAAVMVIHSQNKTKADQALSEAYSDPKLVKHRWWFPEETYRNTTLGKVFSGLVDRDTWRSTMDYFLFREGVRDRIGSEDAWVYFSNETPSSYEATSSR